MSHFASILDLPPRHRGQAERKLAEQKRIKAEGKRKRPGPGKKIPPINASVLRLTHQLRDEGIAGFVTEYLFHPKRKWRLDFAKPDAKLAVEIEGLTFKGGRHQRFVGFTEDCKKYAEAVLLGWRLLRVTPAMVRHGLAIEYIKRALIQGGERAAGDDRTTRREKEERAPAIPEAAIA